MTFYITLTFYRFCDMFVIGFTSTVTKVFFGSLRLISSYPEWLCLLTVDVSEIIYIERHEQNTFFLSSIISCRLVYGFMCQFYGAKDALIEWSISVAG